METEGRKHLEAICSFLARRYTAPDMGVVNWVCGNEVNAWKDYHYCGNISFDQYMEYYAQAYQVLYNSVKHAYTNGRIYMSIDHTWTYNRRANCYTSKAVLDCFAQLMKTKGIPDWMIAFHPYPSPELQSDFWNKTLNVIDSENSPIITMANLSYFTDYVKKNYGEGRRIILSECGFTSVSNGNEKQDVQAAAIAYGYYLAEANDMWIPLWYTVRWITAWRRHRDFIWDCGPANRVHSKQRTPKNRRMMYSNTWTPDII